MANYSTLISQITSAINTNGSQLITGASLQAVLLQMVSELGQAGYMFGGVVNPGDSPASSDSNLFYVAATEGTYTNFNGATVSGGEIAIFTYSGGSWTTSKVLSVQSALEALEQALAQDGVSGSEYAYSTFTQGTPSITLSNVVQFTQVGDYVEFKAQANNGGPILRMASAYNQPGVYYSAANTFIVRFTQSASPFSYTSASVVDRTRAQIIRIELDSLSSTTYGFKIYIDGSLVGSPTVTTSGTIKYDQLGYNSLMELYYMQGKSGGVDFYWTKFAEFTGASNVTDVYSTITIPSLTQLDARLSAEEGKMTTLESAVFGENMYYSYHQTSSFYNCSHDFCIYQRLKGNAYIMTVLGYYNLAGKQSGYWRLERTNIVTITDGVVATVHQALTAGENEFVLQWTAGAAYNADGGFTGGYHGGETIENVAEAWVEFIIDGSRFAPSADISLVPCTSFKYREYAPLYNMNDSPVSIAAWHLKETELKDRGYETKSEVQFVQTLDYFAYGGIVCVDRWVSQYAMPEGVATITDMGTGTPIISEQFKNNGHSIHYEGNGYACDVYSETLFGADDALCERVVYNSSAYNKFYRKTPTITGNTLNRLETKCRVEFNSK